MYDPEHHSFASEFYTVEKVLEVVCPIGGEDQSIRIEALRDRETNSFSTRAYIKESVTLQPSYPQSTSEGFEKKPQNYRVWVSFDLPWTNGTSADDVLRRALSFLKERSS